MRRSHTASTTRPTRPHATYALPRIDSIAVCVAVVQRSNGTNRSGGTKNGAIHTATAAPRRPSRRSHATRPTHSAGTTNQVQWCVHEMGETSIAVNAVAVMPAMSPKRRCTSRATHRPRRNVGTAAANQ